MENRPALIKYVAILERILQANSLILNECRTCLPELLAKIWQLIPDPIAKPHSSRSPYIDSDVLFAKLTPKSEDFVTSLAKDDILFAFALLSFMLDSVSSM